MKARPKPSGNSNNLSKPKQVSRHRAFPQQVPITQPSAWGLGLICLPSELQRGTQLSRGALSHSHQMQPAHRAALARAPASSQPPNINSAKAQICMKQLTAQLLISVLRGCNSPLYSIQLYKVTHSFPESLFWAVPWTLHCQICFAGEAWNRAVI